MCKSVLPTCKPHVYLVHMGVRVVLDLLKQDSCEPATMWVLDMESVSSGRAASIRKHWTISPGPSFHILRNFYSSLHDGYISFQFH